MASPAHRKNLGTWDLVLDFVFAEQQLLSPAELGTRAGSRSISQDAGASSPAYPPEQLSATSPEVLVVTQLIAFSAVPVFTKCFLC